MQDLLNNLIDIVIKEGSSDLHISSGRPPIIRVAGVLISITGQNVLSSEDTSALAALLMSEEKFGVFKKEQEIDFSYTTRHGARFRGNAFFQKGSVSIALRLIPADIKSLAEINLPTDLERFPRL